MSEYHDTNVCERNFTEERQLRDIRLNRVMADRPHAENTLALEVYKTLWEWAKERCAERVEAVGAIPALVILAVAVYNCGREDLRHHLNEPF